MIEVKSTFGMSTWTVELNTEFERDILEFRTEELIELRDKINKYIDENIMDVDDGKRCSDCHFAYYRETGYSNWTVEGCDINCSLKLNPNFPVDNFYNEDIPGNDYANKCNKWANGVPSKYGVGENCPFE